MKVHGSCHCQATAYEAEIDPDQVTICHCTDCQSLTGTVYRVSVPARVEDFVLKKGTPKVYVKTGDSGAKRAQAFCSECGSPLYTYAVNDPKMYGLRTGAIAERKQLVPRKQIWCQSAMPWALNIQGLPKSPRE